MGILVLISVAVVLTIVGFLVAVTFRKVVPTNEVHIIQSAKETKSYGKDSSNGNSYYSWPSSLPLLGVQVSKLPTSVFALELDSYEAYDKGRLPFNVDVKAFFRISDSNVAAQRVSNFKELEDQLKAIVQGAVRTILASSEIEEIMQGRSSFGEQFTKEVSEQLPAWGVDTVKSIELMDIRDSNGSNVIKNIMEKKKSHIEMESRTEVAENKRKAETKEIEAQREIEVQRQEASQTIGLKKIQTERAVELSSQEKIQSIKEQEKLTKEREMEVVRVQEIKKSEILKQITVIKAEQDKEAALIAAEANKQTEILRATGNLEAKKREAEGIAAEGLARAEAEKAIQLAPVEAQIVLAKEIGSNESYQKYLVTIRQVEASQAVGIEQAKALTSADIKVIANAGDASSGLNSVMDVFSSKGGTQVGAMLEGLANTETGKALLSKITT